ncbi:MAG TPA: hypothetical protein VFB26_10535 [Gaiellaceae bacterium]|nr:hypothetical protein [Gaiellaceae bacterium]
MEVDAHHEAQQLTYAFLGLLVLEGGAARLRMSGSSWNLGGDPRLTIRQ